MLFTNTLAQVEGKSTKTNQISYFVQNFKVSFITGQRKI